MRHKIKWKKLNRTSPHRKSMFANMANSLIINEQIQTTLPKAKALRPIVEKLVTKAKKNTIASRRDIISKLQNKDVANKLISVFVKRYKNRNGGYTRIVKAGFRYGDRAPMAYIEFVERDLAARGAIKTHQVKNDKGENNHG